MPHGNGISVPGLRGVGVSSRETARYGVSGIYPWVGLMAKRRRLSIKQYIPDGPEPMFQEVVETPGLTYWHGRLQDAIQGDEPEFRHIPSRKNPPTPLRVACAFAGELNEARGLVWMRYVQDGIPVWSGIFASNGGQVVFCIRSTDELFCPIDRDIMKRLDRQQAQWNLRNVSLQ